MYKVYLISSILSLITSLLMFFVIIVLRQIPLQINILLENGEYTNKFIFSSATYFPPVITLLLAIYSFYLYIKNKS